MHHDENDSVTNYGDIANYGGTFTQGGSHTHNGADRLSAQKPLQSHRDGQEEDLTDRSRNVFVVYGRDAQARDAIFGLLRRLDLRPLEWEPLVRAAGGGSPYLGQVLAEATSQAQAAVVVLSPDDMVLLHPELRSAREDAHELRPALQARPNVLLELGMVLALYPENTVICEFGDLRPVADIAGRNVVRFHDGVSLPESLRKVAGRLEQAGCPVDDSGADWLDARPFAGLRAYRRQAK
jgi:predicted nucleotide-binding protein